MSYYRARAHTRRLAAINARWPKRDRRTDGWIGDKKHRKRKSDHNPDYSAGGVVRASDTDRDGIHVPTVIAADILHESTQYVIHNRRIYSRSRGFRPARYTGSNPHTSHIHTSTRRGKRYEDSGARWTLLSTVPNWSVGIRKSPRKKAGNREVQAYLIAHGASLILDGWFGNATDKALRAFQGKHDLRVDGIAGPKTLAKMRTA